MPPAIRSDPVVLGGVVTAGWLVALWWSARRSLDLLLFPPDGMRICPAVMPAPPSCTPERQVTVAVVASAVLLVAYAVQVVLARRERTAGTVRAARRGPSPWVVVAWLAALGALAYVVTADLNRILFLLSLRG